VSDLRTTPAAATTSPEFAITFDAEKTLFFDASGQASPSGVGADSYCLTDERKPFPYPIGFGHFDNPF
jgi:hypothetical protein